MSKVLRRKMVDELARKLQDVQNLVLVDYRGMTGHQGVEFRAELRKEKARMSVLKNSTAKHALQKLGYPELGEKLADMSALVYGGDPVAVAKVIHSFKEKAAFLRVRGAVIEGRSAGAETVEALSKLPSRHQLLGKFVGLLAAPSSAFVRTLAAVPSQFVRALAAVQEKQQKAGA